MRVKNNTYTKEQADGMVEAAKLEVIKARLIGKVDPNRYCDTCQYCPCACHLMHTNVNGGK